MIKFKLVPHDIFLHRDGRLGLLLRDILPGRKLVEIWIDGKMVGCLYPQEPNSVQLISNHLEAGPYIEGASGLLCVTRFDFEP